MTAPIAARYVARFNELVQKASGDGCWLWLGSRDIGGYGRAVVRPRRAMAAHRASWLIHVGPIPEGLCVLHHCDNRPCVRPDHLFLGDRADNARDMAAKGRQHVQRNPGARPVCPPERKARGERNPRARVTADQVLEIRRRFAAGERKASLCRAFGVGFCAITSIVTGLTWKHVPGPLTEVA
jgi:HNH endonuclease